jgi:hypothetical protein
LESEFELGVEVEVEATNRIKYLNAVKDDGKMGLKKTIKSQRLEKR